MKTPCDNLAGAGGGRSPLIEDPRIYQCRLELHAFITEITTLIDKRLIQLSEILSRDQRADIAILLANSDPLALIAKETAASFNVDVNCMYSVRRTERMFVPRQAAMYLARRLTKFSLADIGEHFGGRDHGTVVHAVRATQKRIDTNPHFAVALKNLEACLRETIGPLSRSVAVV